MKEESGNYDVFISGDTIDLVVPNLDAIEKESWYSWFNNPEVTQHIEHGLFPNTPQKQEDFLRSCQSATSDRLVLLVRPKGYERCIGVTSLSSINWQHRSAQSAVVLGGGKKNIESLLCGIEAKARITEHGFAQMGLERVWGAQARPLAEWQIYQSIFGFSVEGIMRRAFKKGLHWHDMVISACLVEDYKQVISCRGDYWPGRGNMLHLMRELRKASVHPVEDLCKELSKLNTSHILPDCDGREEN